MLQVALVPVAVYPSLSARLTGEEYLLAVRPVDPIEPFRGAYVALDYPGLPPAGAADGTGDEPAGMVYVPLRPDGDLWRGGAVSTRRPAAGPYLRCESKGWARRCGIESLFLPQDKAARLEDDLAKGRAVARVRVDTRGNAAVVAVEPRTGVPADG
jgi:uncharacterized membrane-anchored protein